MRLYSIDTPCGPKSHLAQQMFRSYRILDDAISEAEQGHTLVGKYILFSGGKDSTVLAHLFRQVVDGAVHIDTTIALPDTVHFVRSVCEEWSLPLTVVRAPRTYEDLVLGRVLATKGKTPGESIWHGFPGPPAHRITYSQLKERPLRLFKKSILNNPRSERVLYIAGTRYAESARRARNVTEHERRGNEVWCSPLAHWTDRDLVEYRKKHDAPLSEVSANLHMSGDCLCGAFAHKGELDEMAFWYPKTAAYIRSLQDQVEAEGMDHAVWGNGGAGASAPGPMCSSCPARHEVGAA